ncbi:MAG TPA: hypothetical protein VIV06_06080 [Candidatus Limnocylindrales bacterium]
MAELLAALPGLIAIGLGLGLFDLLAGRFGEDSRDSYPDDHRRPTAGGF